MSTYRLKGMLDSLTKLAGGVVEEIIGIYRFRKLVKGILFATLGSPIDRVCRRQRYH
jgi:hypothetical protein